MHKRDEERDRYIYQQHKEEKRTYASIGEELGISASHVGSIYRRMDFRLNGLQSDFYQRECTRAYVRVDGMKVFRHEGKSDLPEEYCVNEEVHHIGEIPAIWPGKTPSREWIDKRITPTGMFNANDYITFRARMEGIRRFAGEQGMDVKFELEEGKRGMIILRFEQACFFKQRLHTLCRPMAELFETAHGCVITTVEREGKTLIEMTFAFEVFEHILPLRMRCLHDTGSLDAKRTGEKDGGAREE